MSDPSIDQSVIILSDLAALPMAYWEKDKLRDRNIVAVIDSAIKKLLSLHFFPVISFSFSRNCLSLLQRHLSISDYLSSLFLWPSLRLTQNEASTERRKSDSDGGERWSEGGKQTASAPCLWSLCEAYPPLAQFFTSLYLNTSLSLLFVPFCCTSCYKLINFWSASSDLNTGIFVQGFGYDPHFLHIYLFVWSFSSSRQVVIPPLTCASAPHHYCHGL